MIKKFFKEHRIHKKIAPSLDKLFFFNPLLLFPVWLMLTVGMAAASINIFKNNIWINDFNLETFYLFIVMTILAIGFLLGMINNGGQDNYLIIKLPTTHKLELSSFNKIFILISTLGIFSLILISFDVFLLTLICWLGLYYSINMKKNKSLIFNYLVICLTGFILFLVGWVYFYNNNGYGVNISLSLDLILKAIPYFICFISVVYCLTVYVKSVDDGYQALDKFDKNRGFHLIVIFAFFVFVAFLIGYFLNDPISSTGALVAFPFYLAAVFRKRLIDLSRCIRFTIFIFTIFIITVYPYLFYPLSLVYFVSKYYYWHRFNLNYPVLFS